MSTPQPLAGGPCLPVFHSRDVLCDEAPTVNHLGSLRECRPRHRAVFSVIALIHSKLQTDCRKAFAHKRAATLCHQPEEAGHM